MMNQYSHVYFIGIGGIGMAALARWFKQHNKAVLGYDQTATHLTAELSALGISIHFQDEVAAIPSAVLQHPTTTLVVYTPAIPEDHVILNYLKEKGYHLQLRAVVLGALTKNKLTIAVGGTHGKTTITAMIAHILYYTHKNMAAFVGGIVQGHNTNYLINCKVEAVNIMVVEADEFNQSFLQLAPNYSIISAIDADHPETYADKGAVVMAFQKLAQNTTKKIIIQTDAVPQIEENTSLSRPPMLDYDFCKGAIHGAHITLTPTHSNFDYVSPALTIEKIKLPMPGYYNINNALAAITVCLEIGIDVDSIRQEIQTFQGIQRRFTYIIKDKNCIFIDDYAHHPAEITTLLETAKSLYPDKRITVIFQPHLYSRTKAFAPEFAASLSLADALFLLPIYPAREAPITGVTSTIIFDQITLPQKWLCTPASLVNLLATHSTSEVTITLGAGDISQLVAPIKQFLCSKYRDHYN